MNRITKRLMLAGTLAAMSAFGPVVGEACFMRSPLPVQVWLDHINVDITDQVAVKIYNCTFRNPNPQAVVGGTCYMELEPGTQVDDMSVLVNGKEMKAEILNVEKANQVFKDIVKNGGSPALLEYFGNQLIQTKVPRIASNGTVTVKLTYTTVLKKRGDLLRLQMLNTNPKALMQPLKSASVTVNIKSKTPIKNIYSPTHKIKIVEKPDWDVAIDWSQDNYMPKHPFVLYYQVSEDELGASVVAHREVEEDGSFMIMLSPTIGQGTGKVTNSQILPKDVVFCVDTSGSMLNNKKMEQAWGALKYCVESLRPGDRFNIVDFSTVARHFHEDGLVEFNNESKARALKYVEKLHARGGTAIQEALELSLKHLGRGDRLKMIVFATDGLPTIGERNPEAILRNMAQKNNQDVRIFVFGEGFDVNTRLLDFLALDHHGEADYILPEEDITKKISRFFDRVGSPIMTDLEIRFEGLDVQDVFPREIPDVFKGEQVVIFGRYSGDGTKTIKVTGTLGGHSKTIEYQLEFSKSSDSDRNSFVPRLWAGKKIDFLLNEIRKSDPPNKELVDEVMRLAMRYGIVTPYTSFLMADDIISAPRGGEGLPGLTSRGLGGRYDAGRRILLRKLNEAKLAESSPSSSRVQRESSVKLAKELADLRRKADKNGLAAYDDQLELAFRRDGKKGSSLAVIRYIGSRTFYKRGKGWQDSVFDPEKHKNIKTIEIGSDDYFKLIKQDGRIAKYLALGDVVVKVKKTWYRFENRRKKG